MSSIISKQSLLAAALIILITVVSVFIFIPNQNKLIGKHLKDVLLEVTENSVSINEIAVFNSKFNFYESKKIICFFSLKCVYCRKAAQQLTIFANQNQLTENVFVFFAGKEVNVNWFFETAQSSHFHYNMMEKETLSQLTDGIVPKIFLLEDGIIREILIYEDLNEMTLKTFFEQ